VVAVVAVALVARSRDALTASTSVGIGVAALLWLGRARTR
jgi:hypothetical protein